MEKKANHCFGQFSIEVMGVVLEIPELSAICCRCGILKTFQGSMEDGGRMFKYLRTFV